MTDPPTEYTTEALNTALDSSESVDAQVSDVDAVFRDFHEWMRRTGNTPDRPKTEPMSKSQAKNNVDRLDQVYRFVIEYCDPDQLPHLTQAHADEINRLLDADDIRTQAGKGYAERSKGKFNDAIQKYFQYLHDTGVVEKAWTPNVTFGNGTPEAADEFSKTEREMLRAVAADYKALPPYYEVDEAERDAINGRIAQELGKPKADITQADWHRADISTKVESLIGVGLDTGLIPAQITEVRTDWYEPQRNVLHIPPEHTAKERPSAKLPLTEATGDALSRWIKERRHVDIYDGTDRLWLNSAGNPYTSANLNYLLRNLCDEAGIDHETRKIQWYSIRHSLGEAMKNETEGLPEPNDQLRHETIEATERYGGTSKESRRETLESIKAQGERTANESNTTTTPESMSDNDHSDDIDIDRTVTRNSDSNNTEPGTTDRTNDVTTPAQHIDVVIEDTDEARKDLAKELL